MTIRFEPMANRLVGLRSNRCAHISSPMSLTDIDNNGFPEIRYETLAVATDVKGKESENISSGKRLAADWVLGLGEAAVSLRILSPETETKDNPHKIVVLGARTLFVLFDTGNTAASTWGRVY